MQASGKRYIIHPSRSDVFTIWNLADLHLIARSCAEDKLRADVQTIRDDPRAFWFGGGDMCDLIGRTDKRFDPNEFAPWVSVKDLGEIGIIGMAHARDILAPIKDKCLGMLKGNHETVYALHNEQEGLHGWLCNELGVKNLEYCAFVDLVFVRDHKAKKIRWLSALPSRDCSCSSFRFFLHHGASFSNTPGGKLKRLIDFMDRFEADCYMLGHVHDQMSYHKSVIGANEACDDLCEIKKIGVVSGSYLKTYSLGSTTYGEMRGYSPTTLGAAGISICPETRKMRAET